MEAATFERRYTILRRSNLENIDPYMRKFDKIMAWIHSLPHDTMLYRYYDPPVAQYVVSDTPFPALYIVMVSEGGTPTGKLYSFSIRFKPRAVGRGAGVEMLISSILPLKHFDGRTDKA